MVAIPAPRRNPRAARMRPRSDQLPRLDEHVRDADLPPVVELLNGLSDVRKWSSLDLSGIQLAGASLTHLRKISRRWYQVIVPAVQVEGGSVANV